MFQRQYYPLHALLSLLPLTLLFFILLILLFYLLIRWLRISPTASRPVMGYGISKLRDMEGFNVSIFAFKFDSTPLDYGW